MALEPSTSEHSNLRRTGRGAGAREHRRAMLDVTVGAALGAVLLLLGPGLGVLAWFGIPLLLLLLLTLAAPRLRRRRRFRR